MPYPTQFWVLVLVGTLILLGLLQWHFTNHIRALLLIIMSGIVSLLISGNILRCAWLFLSLILTVGTWRLTKNGAVRNRVGIFWILFLVACLALVKLLTFGGSAITIQWIGISYLIFRLIHVTLDARRGRLPESTTISETINYALHPASLVAGPIDRIQQNIDEQKKIVVKSQYVANGTWRILTGVFKKIVLANLCYEFILVETNNIWPKNSTLSIWVWLLAYTFYVYFDFAGYSDIAIGSGLLMGIRLPENFNNPYWQPDISHFWQNWHITLSTWLRDYIYFPVSRSLLKRTRNRYSVLIAFISHILTMLVCGLWHGLGSGFILWGLWHGAGLFVHSQLPKLQKRYGFSTPPRLVNIVFTFSFVALGWVFFSTDAANALVIFRRLFGL